MGTAGGFKIIIEDRGGKELKDLQAVSDGVVAQGPQLTSLQSLFSSVRADTPWLSLDIDRDQAKIHGLSLDEVFNTLQVYLASFYVNDFNFSGRTWQVNVQADANALKSVYEICKIKVRNSSGTMVPLATVTTVRPVSGPAMIQRYNLYLAASRSTGRRRRALAPDMPLR